MSPLSDGAASAYRRVDLDARIEASSSKDLTRICLEEAVASLGQALLVIEKDPEQIPQEPLSRAHGIAVWLARGVSPDNPLSGALVQFYGAMAATLARNLTRSSSLEIAEVRSDLNDLLEAARTA